jgi:hypothetical protein
MNEMQEENMQMTFNEIVHVTGRGLFFWGKISECEGEGTFEKEKVARIITINHTIKANIKGIERKGPLCGICPMDEIALIFDKKDLPEDIVSYKRGGVIFQP